MINAADNRRRARRLFLSDVVTLCYLYAATLFVWHNAGLAGSTVGFAAGFVVACWPALYFVLPGRPENRPTLRRIRREEHLLRAAQKVAAVVARSERSGHPG
jgi:hypothetical protein